MEMIKEMEKFPQVYCILFSIPQGFWEIVSINLLNEVFEVNASMPTFHFFLNDLPKTGRWYYV